jgi:hypothetical protein
MSMVCRLIGHRFRNTLAIRDDGDFFEVDNAQYCRMCGRVHAAIRLNQLATTLAGVAFASASLNSALVLNIGL